MKILSARKKFINLKTVGMQPARHRAAKPRQQTHQPEIIFCVRRHKINFLKRAEGADINA